MTCLKDGHRLMGALIGLLAAAAAEFSAADSSSLKHIANVSFAAEDTIATGSASMFSPRMDFEQWRPLTGRGDPLRNDPTYDYEPPVLERVHYWAEDTRLEREHYPERKSEVLMLGVSSRKPSIGAHQPPPPSRRPHRPAPPKYEDFQYKLSDHYHMTILVPPPLPPPGHKTPLFIIGEEKFTQQVPHTKPSEHIYETRETTTTTPEHLTSLYALQESNLIYQSSTTNQNWIVNSNHTKSNYSSVSSDYAGWGPTTPLDESDVNDTLNFILNDHFDLSKQPYAFYKPMLSEAPPPPHGTHKPILLPTFIPTAPPPTEKAAPPLTTYTEATSTWTVSESYTETPEYYDDTTADKQSTHFLPTPAPAPRPRPTTESPSIFDMFGSMMGMPLVNGPERPEDNLYAHASNNIQVFKEQLTEEPANLETMQTMQPPPVSKTTESTNKQSSHVNPFVSNGLNHKKPTPSHDPYLHMRYTTPSTTSAVETSEQHNKPTTEVPAVPMYLIIQGHSKVKTYGSKPKPSSHNNDIDNEIPKQNETNEVKHLHPIKDKMKHEKPATYRTSRTQNLKSLLNNGFGSIEIQETNVGIKYDVSDGSDVPAEIYRKGIVDSDLDIDNYKNKKLNEKRTKRQVGLDDLLPFDEDKIEEYVFDFLRNQRNDTGITGLIAQAVTSDAAASVVDDLEDEDEDDEDDDEDDDDDDDDDDDLR